VHLVSAAEDTEFRTRKWINFVSDVKIYGRKWLYLSLGTFLRETEENWDAVAYTYCREWKQLSLLSV
jgi:hypothetical protein